MKTSLRWMILALTTLGLSTLTAFGHGGGEASIEIGSDKGVTEVSKDKSFKLSPEATKNFGVKSIIFTSGTITVPKDAIVHTLKEAQLFRLRGGFLKSIDFKAISKNDRTWTIQSSDLQAKDEIVISGVGFLRIISAQLGAAEEEEGEDEHGHAHGKEEKEEHGHDHGEDHHD